MKLKSLIFSAALASVLSVNVSAEQDPNPFANCGIGAALFKNDTGAIISNVIWDLGSTALTSGVSSPGTCEGAEAKTAQFIYDSYNDIAEQTSKGKGDHVTAMLNLAGCSSDAHAEVLGIIREDFAKDVSQQGYSEQTILQKSESYYNSVSDSAKGICSIG